MDSLSSTRSDEERSRLPLTLLVRAAATLALIDAAVRVLPFPRLLALVRWLSGGAPTRDEGPPASLPAAIERVGRLMPWAHCVPRALACHILVRRAGHPCSVIFGVARTGERDLVAHAWPESMGTALIGPFIGDHTYSRLAPLDL